MGNSSSSEGIHEELKKVEEKGTVFHIGKWHRTQMGQHDSFY